MHIREDHSAVVADPGSASASKSAVIDVPVKCNMASCASKQFSSIKLLMTHFNSYHKKDARECVFFLSSFKELYMLNKDFNISVLLDDYTTTLYIERMLEENRERLAKLAIVKVHKYHGGLKSVCFAL